MIFYIYGTDAYLCREKIKEVESGFIQKKDRGGLNVIRLNNDDLSFEKIKSEALTVPFLSEKKLIIITDLIGNNKAGAKKIRDDVANFLETEKEKINNNLLFVDVFETEKKIPEKDKLFNLLKKSEYCWFLPTPNNSQLKKWLSTYCSKNKIKIDDEAITEIITLIGNDLMRLVNELNKIKHYDSEKISRAIVKELVKANYQDDIFKLTDALADKNRKLALNLLSRQLIMGNEPLALLGTINWQFKSLLKIKSTLLSDPKITPNKIASEIGLHPFVVTKNINAVKKFTLEELINIQNELFDLETQLKSGAKNPELLFDLFITKHSNI